METTFWSASGRRAAFAASALAALTLLVHGTASAQSTRGRPARIVLQPDSRVVQLGSSVKVAIRLMDAFDKPASAPKPLAIELEIRLPSKKSSKQTVTIPNGRDSQDAQLTFNEVGIVQVFGRNPEVYEGTTFIQVRKTLAKTPSAIAIPRLLPIALQEPPAQELTLQILAPAGDKIFLANGQDKAPITVFLSDAAAQPVKIEFRATGGRLAPKQLDIPAGEFSADAELTATEPGTVTLAFMGSAPRIRPAGAKEFQLTFKRPIDKVLVTAAWNAISLFESIDLTVSLRSTDNQPVAADKISVIDFSFGSGRGQIVPSHFTFQPGQQDGVARFTPIWGGPVRVQARTLNVDSGNVVTFGVVWPWESFLLTGLAALGCVAFRNRRRGTPWSWSTAVGAGLGFVACWAIVLGLVTMIPPRWLLNPVMPLVLSGAIAWGASAVAERRPFPIRGGVFRRPALGQRPALTAIGSVDAPPTGETSEPEVKPGPAARPFEVFFSYAREDEKLLNQLAAHMSLMERNGLVVLWHDRRIEPGDQWSKDINEHLKSADIILLLISADFLASDYANKVEVTLALERHRAGQARVIPVILRAADWQQPPLDELQALPTDGRPITSYENPDEALREVAEAIREIVTTSHHAVA